MPLKKRRSPQEKKRLSLEKDCRNDYGGSDKAARKAIPLRKAKLKRALRRAAKVALASEVDPKSQLNPNEVGSNWRKSPDLQLKFHLEKMHGASLTNVISRKTGKVRNVP